MLDTLLDIYLYPNLAWFSNLGRTALQPWPQNFKVMRCLPSVSGQLNKLWHTTVFTSQGKYSMVECYDEYTITSLSCLVLKSTLVERLHLLVNDNQFMLW